MISYVAMIVRGRRRGYLVEKGPQYSDVTSAKHGHSDPLFLADPSL